MLNLTSKHRSKCKLKSQSDITHWWEEWQKFNSVIIASVDKHIDQQGFSQFAGGNVNC